MTLPRDGQRRGKNLFLACYFLFFLFYPLCLRRGQALHNLDCFHPAEESWQPSRSLLEVKYTAFCTHELYNGLQCSDRKIPPLPIDFPCGVEHGQLRACSHCKKKKETLRPVAAVTCAKCTFSAETSRGRARAPPAAGQARQGVHVQALP